MISCEKVRPYLPALAGGDPENRIAAQFHQHAADCPDCRKDLETSRRLRSLLALKRHEKPDEFFFRAYLSEFHRRLLSEIVRKKSSLWERIREVMTPGWGPADILLRLSYSAAIGVVVLSLYTARISLESGGPSHFVYHQAKGYSVETSPSLPSAVEVASSPRHLILANNYAGKKPVYVLDRVNYESPRQGTVVLQF